MTTPAPTTEKPAEGTPAPATGAGTQTDAEKQAQAADSKKGGFMESIMGFINMIVEWVSSLFGGGNKDNTAAAEPSASSTPSKPQEEDKGALDAKAQAAALAAVKGNPAAGTGATVTESSTPIFPEAVGPLIKGIA